MTTVAVRVAPLRESDLPRCAELERVLFAADDPWSLATLRSELRAGHHYFGAYAGDTLIGYAGLAVAGRRGDREASVHTIGVDPAWQGKGVGTALVRSMLAIADEAKAPVFLEVRTDNAAAIRLYEAHGFVRLGVRRRYYQPSNADAYTMGRPPVGHEGFE
ncbi:MAG TPA: ribosomal protein S18-alanine N-acetyltransferase [Pseudonocardiaceae bacterium]|nr:ribosomal protein S18-alanine N-acetyltransferase [Pseudonocardiaceae bacterium]